MKMRQRKQDLYARVMLGLRIRELLAELDEAADVLIEAFESGSLAQPDDGEKQTGA
jgi:hypothetical protein